MGPKSCGPGPGPGSLQLLGPMGSFWIPWAPFGVHGPYQILKDTYQILKETYQILKETYPILKETYQILSTPKGLGFWFWTYRALPIGPIGPYKGPIRALIGPY